MFNLDHAIAEWRRKMLAAGIQTPVPMDELENHLREDIEQQTKSGRSETEAFMTAVQKIGPTHAIQNEFEKVEETEEERKWIEGQIWSGAILGLLQLIVIGAVLFNPYMTSGQRVSGLVAIATAILLVVVVGQLSHQIFPVIRAPRNRTVIAFIFGGVPAIIWSGIFACFVLPKHEFPFGQWLTTLFWACSPPLGAFLGLIWGIETAARKKSGGGGFVNGSEQYV